MKEDLLLSNITLSGVTNMKRIALTTVLVIGLSAPVLADTQLSSSMGVAQAVNTTAQPFDANVSRYSSFVVTASGRGISPHYQLEQSLNVPAGQYSLLELVQIRNQIERGVTTPVLQKGNALSPTSLARLDAFTLAQSQNK
ncbi:MAG: hypothetical protein ACI8TF_001504 [Paracoccaceae bacterium]|jgi:hypothetical protein